MSNLAQALVNELEREARSTRRLLERVPADRLDWQPHPKSMTLGQLALHLASIPGNISRLASLDGFDAAKANFAPASPPDAEVLLATLETSLADARSFLDGLDEEGAAAPWRLSAGEREVFTLPRAEVVRTLMLNHWYHHRGQLAVYLRLLDVPVPVVYGRSADENPFATAA
ncbi:MAG TPA: DinB family protein [Thermoanaerobaculia bacterium]